MFFVLSKTLNYLTMPLVIVVVVLGLSFILKRKKLRRYARIIGFGLLVFFSNEFIANEVMTWWEIPATPFASLSKPYDVGIVLTGVTKNDLQPDDRVYFSQGADRVTHTVDLYKRGFLKRIVISGGVGRLVTHARKEAEEFRKVMMMMGVPDSIMVVESESRNTHESAVRVGRMLEGHGGTRLLITSACHLRRARACFNHEGVKCDLFAVDFNSHPRYWTFDVLFIPKLGAIENWHRLLKEWTGMLAYRVAGYI